MRPSRVTQLTETQEKARLQCSVQDQHRKLCVAAFGSVGDLKHYVADPEHFIANRSRSVVGTNDKVPVWIKFGSQKQLHFANERRKNSMKTIQTRPSQSFISYSERHSLASLHELPQLRGNGSPSDEKFRITVDMHTVVEGYFDPEAAEPVGRLLDTMIVRPGQYCRFSNVSPHGTFPEDEHFEVGGELVTRRAGTSAKGLMSSYVKLRSSHPKLFSSTWTCTSSLQVWQRDCLATYFTPEAQAAPSSVVHE